MPDEPAASLPRLHDGLLERYRAFVAALGVLFSCRSAQDIVRVAHEQLLAIFDAPILVIAWTREQGGWFCQMREGDELYESEIPARNDGLFERVLAGTFEATGDVLEYARTHDLFLRELRDDDDDDWSRSWMGVPLVIDGRTRGVLSLQSYEPNAFHAEDLELLRVMAAHLGVAFENAELRTKLEAQAHTDALTDLPNRRAFDEALETSWHATAEWTLVVLDVQEFKAINDTFGHDVGDAVLRELARLLASVPTSPEGAFRLGGDEFALLLRGDGKAAAHRLNAWFEAVERFSWPHGHHVGVNAGACERREASNAETWLRLADRRMYEAKARRAPW
ncbi:GGDEF domain-containing protein [Deinococcus yavapaiensis]|uniref:Diguanylate cyclase (GGDEF)-like protein n=1 Tax=Deinococcus yavapaiensis KR-236 TaxID=694435 RepID=A0A318S492_9DEIO|nr:sensor domain-containing diguanylate cyclase [Deinococcus yavapaiensis]PYE53256.1 diguanylate cyclase (GGDEF)-like protein [Deinococcus yavapaiensis KR-236]